MTHNTAGNTSPVPTPRESRCRLAINVSQSIVRPSAEHNLLVGFHFGSDTSPGRPSGVVNIGLDPIDGGDLFECWWFRGDVDHDVIGNATVAQCEDYTVVVVQVPDASPQDFRTRSHDAYQELLDVAQQVGHSHLVKIWNYFPSINMGDDDREKYRQFSIGRAEAFEHFGIIDSTVPTGTAVGCTRDSDLTIVALMSKHGLLSAENPRQVSAFEYPRQYGPRSPKFSRGGCVRAGNHDLFVISGTAAIVGHESVHPNDINLQTTETLANLHHLCDAVSKICGEEASLGLEGDSVLRVYLRNPDDLAYVTRELTSLLGNVETNVVFLHAHICRRELLIEIDGVQIAS